MRKEGTMVSLIVLYSLLLLVDSSYTRYELNHSFMEKIVFKNSPKKWFSYLTKLLQISLTKISESGCMTSQKSIMSYLLECAFSLGQVSSSLREYSLHHYLHHFTPADWKMIRENCCVSITINLIEVRLPYLQSSKLCIFFV